MRREGVWSGGEQAVVRLETTEGVRCFTGLVLEISAAESAILTVEAGHGLGEGEAGGTHAKRDPYGVQKRAAKTSRPISTKRPKSSLPTLDNPQCRLLNPSKSELGRAAKQILTRINKELKRITGLTQWEFDQKCLEWFNALENKPRLRFIKADIDPSISEELLTWASTLLRLVT